MKKYIERAEAIKRIKEYSLTAYDINLDNKEEFAGNSLPENYCEGLYEATELLDDLPAADVVEVRHGRWIKKHRHRGGFRRVTGIDDMGETHTITVDERVEYDDLYCSECGKQSADNFLNYCPNCGARMDKEDEHEAD